MGGLYNELKEFLTEEIFDEKENYIAEANAN